VRILWKKKWFVWSKVASPRAAVRDAAGASASGRAARFASPRISVLRATLVRSWTGWNTIDGPDQLGKGGRADLPLLLSW
jgi:hypothetical protein